MVLYVREFPRSPHITCVPSLQPFLSPALRWFSGAEVARGWRLFPSPGGPGSALEWLSVYRWLTGPGGGQGLQEAWSRSQPAGVSAFQVAAGLYQRAFQHLSEAVRTAAQEEAGRPAWGQEPARGLVAACLALVEFCDQRLRKQEEGPPGEPHACQPET